MNREKNRGDASTHSAGNRLGEEAMNCPSLMYVVPNCHFVLRCTVAEWGGGGGHVGSTGRKHINRAFKVQRKMLAAPVILDFMQYVALRCISLTWQVYLDETTCHTLSSVNGHGIKDRVLDASPHIACLKADGSVIHPATGEHKGDALVINDPDVLFRDRTKE